VFLSFLESPPFNLAYFYLELEINLPDLCFQRMLLGLDAEFVALSPAEKVRLLR